ATRASTSVESGTVDDVTAVATLDWPTNEKIGRRSSPSGDADRCGKRRKASQPAVSTAAVETAWAATIAATVAVSPCVAATAIAVKRSAIERHRKAPRMS